MPPGTIFTHIAAGGQHNLALKNDGTVVAWGANWSGQSTVPAGLTNVITLAAGWSHSLALRGDGTVVAWGQVPTGRRFPRYEEASVPADLSGVIAVAANASYSLALKSDGIVVAWGANFSGQSTVPAGLNNVIAIAAGYSHSLALVADPPPALAVEEALGALMLSWSSPADGYALESAPGLGAGAWPPVPHPPALVAGRLRVTNAIIGGAQFFRLKRQ